VVRDLVFAGKRNFQDFMASPERIASNILADRLARLERAGIVERRRDPANARRVDVRLTAKGLDLIPLLLEMIRWGGAHDPDTAAPAAIRERLVRDRDGFAAELRARALARDA
jgi:DNA-binding HxlR family transcriptional regulator